MASSNPAIVVMYDLFESPCVTERNKISNWRQAVDRNGSNDKKLYLICLKNPLAVLWSSISILKATYGSDKG